MVMPRKVKNKAETVQTDRYLHSLDQIIGLVVVAVVAALTRLVLVNMVAVPADKPIILVRMPQLISEVAVVAVEPK
jgi:hypothetical protein